MTLETLTVMIGEHGLVLFFALGFAEFIGIPVASVPALVVGGALARTAPGAEPFMLVAAAALGGWAADGLLYAITRWKGEVMLDVACGLTSNRNACVINVSDRVGRVGPAFVFGAKFLPGAGNLIGPAVALAGVRARDFLFRDLIALLVWAGVYTGAGWIFAPQVEALVALTTRYLVWLVPLAVVLVGLASLWRLWRVRVHTRLHQQHGESA